MRKSKIVSSLPFALAASPAWAHHEHSVQHGMSMTALLSIAAIIGMSVLMAWACARGEGGAHD